MGLLASLVGSLARRAAPRRARLRFDAAQTTRDNAMHWAMADGASPDAEASPEVRAKLRQRSRYEVLNNSYAEGLVEMLQNDAIGTGPRLQMLLDDDALADRLEEDFASWASDARLAEKLQVMKRARCTDGESFAVLSTNPGLRGEVKLDLQVVEADLVRSAPGEEDSPGVVDGIRYDEYGNPESYSISSCYPGDSEKEVFRSVPAASVLHTYKIRRPGLHRGIPELTSALPLFAQLRRYNLACLSAAEAAADFSAILYTDSPPDGECEEIEPLDSIPLQRNMMLSVPAGWKLGQLEGKHPTSNHSEFVKSILSEIARCVCSTYGAVSGDYSGYNYASGRLDAQLYQRSVVVDRAKWERDVLDPVFAAWLREWSLVTGVRPASVRRAWFWDGFLHVDPTKEADAQAVLLENSLTSLSAEYAKRGKDWRVEVDQLARERKIMRRLGLAVPAGSGGRREDARRDDVE